MLNLLTDRKKFAILFFSFLFLDILVKNTLPLSFRYLSKALLLPLLLLFYYLNNTEEKKGKTLWVVLSLFCFFLGDLLIISHQNVIFLALSMFVFSLGKLFLSFKLSHKSDFQVTRLLPFSLVIFVYTVGLVSFLYEGLKEFFFPAIISFFISLLLFQFTFLRKDVVDRKSYNYVFYGVIVYMIAESVMAIKTFRTDIPFQSFIIMFCYGTGLFLIVQGITFEKKVKISNPF